MAANNYFGIAHGGTQYRASPSIVLSAQPATAYPAAQTAYVQPTHQTAYATAATAPRPGAAYEAYPTAAAAGQYAYTAAARTGATVTYDSKGYYTPTCAAVTPTVYTFADASAYQAAKPAYSTTSYTTPCAVRHTGNKPVVAPTQAASYTIYPGGANVAANAAQAAASVLNTTTGGTYSGYDAALYSAATTYYHQQQAAKAGGATWTLYKTKAAAGSALNVGRSHRFNIKGKGAMQPQLHYCEVCKISCAGPQTYREHLEGQKHKKKDAAAKAGSATTTSSSRGSQNQLRCELCDVACTGTDAYAAHIRGAKHQKVLKLHTILGKPIPAADPVSSSNASATTSSSTDSVSSSSSKVGTGAVKTTDSSTAKKGLSTPKITFVNGVKDEKGEDPKHKQVIPEEDEKDVVPVGQEYIDEVKNEGGKVVSFNCKLCECKFNDPNAKEMHMKGRRHRLQYKKKVDPSLQVEVKPSIRMRKIQEDKLRRQAIKEEYYRRREAQDRWRDEMRMMMEEEAYFMGRGFGRGGMPFGPHGPMGFRRQDTNDDRHVMGKHAAIYPTESELQAVQSMVASCEKALKLVSDFVAESDGPLNDSSNEDDDNDEVIVKIEKDENDSKENSFQDKKDEGISRTLKGVMRVGVLAKGLLLHSDLNVQLVLLCSEKPTRTLLERVADCLPKQLAIVAEDNKYEVKMCVEEAAVIVSTTAEPSPVCSITLTSPIMRDENLLDGESAMVKDPPDVLDRQKCLAALAALRHAKWFQARANGLQSCVIVIRILRDLCQRVPTWTPLPEWAMELLVEKCISSGGTNMTPGDALRRVFECVASGILLPGGPGLYDPCEKDATDAADELSAQEREDITASAQHALRLIAFRQIHKVLGMEPLPLPRFLHRKPMFNNPRKRRRDTTSSDPEGSDAGKKDKKEVTTTTPTISKI